MAITICIYILQWIKIYWMLTNVVYPATSQVHGDFNFVQCNAALFHLWVEYYYFALTDNNDNFN